MTAEARRSMSENAAPSDRGSGLFLLIVCLVAALSGVLFGFDTAVISGALGMLKRQFQLSPAMEGWTVTSVLIGCLAGVTLAGPLSDRFGRRIVLMLSAVLFTISAIWAAVQMPVPESFEWLFGGIKQLIAARLVGGMGIGIASMLAPLYIAEISPPHLRGRLISLYQFAIASGILVSYFVNFGIVAHGLGEDRAALVQSSVGQTDSTNDAQRVRQYVEDQLKAKAESDLRDQRGPTPWEADAAERFESALKADAARIAREKTDAFLAGATTTPNSDAIATFLTGEKVRVDPAAVELARQGKTSWNDLYGWRWMFGSGTAPAILFLLLLFIVPESPRWLTKQGQTEAATAILARVAGPVQAAREMKQIQETIAQESGSLTELFKSGMRVRLLIGMALPFFSQIVGINAIIYYGPRIFEQAGYGQGDALGTQVLFGAVNVVFTLIAILFVDKLGRRPLLLAGIVGTGISIALAGLLFHANMTKGPALVLLCAIYLACFSFSYGPVCWIIVSELFPTRIRGRAMSLSIFSLWTGCILVSQTFPVLQKYWPPAWTFWLYASTAPVALLFVWFLVPETKGKTLEQIETQWFH
jgi:MFS family permease